MRKPTLDAGVVLLTTSRLATSGYALCSNEHVKDKWSRLYTKKFTFPTSRVVFSGVGVFKQFAWVRSRILER